MPASAPPPTDPIDAAWQRVEARWDDPEAHRAFLSLCFELERMPEAARRYREVRDGDPDRRGEAETRIDQLLTMATRQLLLSRTPAPPGRARRRLLWVAMGLSLGMISFVVWTILRAG
jgi:hypothetical protein